MTRIGRNERCPCGSGKKYKHCCLRNPQSRSSVDQTPHLTPVEEMGNPIMREVSGDQDLYEFSPNDTFDPPVSDEELKNRVIQLNPLILERVLVKLKRALQSIDVPKDEEEQLLQEWADQGRLPDVAPATPLEAAQDLMYQAWLDAEEERMAGLAHEALSFSNDCADAYLLLADMEVDVPEQMLDLTRQAVQAGERALGLEKADEDPPDLTHNVAAWPYLRAKVQLAQRLIENEQYDEATEHLEDVVRFDRNDGQEARYSLLAIYLVRKEYNAVRTLAKRFEDEDSAAWLYAEALIAFQKTGNGRQARRLLERAIDENPYFAAVLTYIDLLLYGEADLYSDDFEWELDAFGSARVQLTAWALTPGALNWLMTEFRERLDDLPRNVRERIGHSWPAPDPSPHDLPPTLGVWGTGMPAIPQSKDPAPEPPMPAVDRRLMERPQVNMHRALDEHDFESAEEANAYLSSLVKSGQVPDFEPRNDLERAQDAVYDALEVEGSERIALARKALEICPDCADAYVLLAEETAVSLEDALDYYWQGMEAGERAIGEEEFRELVGEFWGFLKTRPYMRALHGVAETLELLGREEEAISHYEEMLRLNPDDNQGIREALLSLYIELGKLREARQLLKKYPNDVLAVWPYSKALLAFIEHGDTKASRRQLEKAIEANRYVPDYLLGYKQIPALPPMYASPGQPSDAMNSALTMLAAWSATRGALDWLAEYTFQRSGR